MVDLTGKVALVTGGGRGIGRGIALVLASRGASVIIGDINGDNAQAVAQEIEGMGYTALAITMDVTSAASVTKALLAVDSQLGAVAVLANNAGVIGAPGNQTEADPKATSIPPTPTTVALATVAPTSTPPNKTIDEKVTGKLVDVLSSDQYPRTNARNLEREFRREPETAKEK